MFGSGFEQGDVAGVVHECRAVGGVGEYQVLDDEFDIDDAATRVFDVGGQRGMGGGDFFAHGEYFSPQDGRIAP